MSEQHGYVYMTKEGKYLRLYQHENWTNKYSFKEVDSLQEASIINPVLIKQKLAKNEAMKIREDKTFRLPAVSHTVITLCPYAKNEVEKGQEQ